MYNVVSKLFQGALRKADAIVHQIGQRERRTKHA